MSDKHAHISRVRKYLDNLAKMKGLHQEDIHGIFVDGEETMLKVSDLRKLVKQAEKYVQRVNA